MIKYKHKELAMWKTDPEFFIRAKAIFRIKTIYGDVYFRGLTDLLKSIDKLEGKTSIFDPTTRKWNDFLLDNIKRLHFKTKEK